MDRKNTESGETPDRQDDILRTAPTIWSDGVTPPEEEEKAFDAADGKASQAEKSNAPEAKKTAPAKKKSDALEEKGVSPEKPAAAPAPEAMKSAGSDAPVAVTMPTSPGDETPIDVTMPTSPGDDAPPAPTAPTAPGEKKKSNSAAQSGALLKAGDKLGKYVIEKRLGKGGMGEVYLAKHEQLGIPRAIKVLPKELASKNSQFFARFIREAKTACEIRHSNIVNVMDVESDEARGLSYIVMEYVDGGDVRGLLKASGHLTVDQTLVIVEAVAAALAAASEYGIVHRDIKPDNIMLTRRGEVKLADLGIAKSGSDEDVQLTKTNVMMGTPAYLSPEQAKDAKHVDVRADIYSLGATMFEMLTGRIPYEGKSVYDILSKLHTDPVPNPCDLNVEIPPEIGKIVMTMMAKKPSDRYQSAAELLEVLAGCRVHRKTAIEAQKIIQEAIKTAYGGESLPPTTTVVRRRRKFKKQIFIAAGACGAVLLVLAVWLLLRPGKGVLSSAQIAPGAGFAPVEMARPTFTVRPAEAVVALRDRNGKEFSAISREGNSAVFELPCGSYTYSVSCDGFASQSGPLDITGGLSRSFSLEPAVFSVQTEPNAAVAVTLDGRDAGSGNADDKGIFSVSGLKAGTYVLEAVLAGKRPRREEVRFAGNGETSFQFRLNPQISSVRLHRLNFRIFPSSASVQVRDRDGQEIYCSSKLGGVCSYELPAGSYVYSVSTPGYSGKEGSCKLSSDTDIPEIRLEPHRISVSSNPGARLELIRNSVLTAASVADEKGTAVFEGIPAGVYLLRGDQEGRVPQAKEVTVPGDRDMNFAITLPLELWDFQIFASEGSRLVLSHDGKKIKEEVMRGSSFSVKLPRGEYQADFSLAGHADRRIQFRVPEDQRITARMERNLFSLTLHVSPNKVRAELRREDGNGKPALVHFSGTHTFSKLAPGNYRLTLSSPGYEDHLEFFTLANDDEDRHITMKKVRLTGADGGGIIVREVTTGNPALDKYIRENGAEIRLKGSNAPWQNVRFPFTMKNLKEGKHVLLFRVPAKKIKGQESDEIAVESGRFTEYSMFLVTF